MTKFGSISFFCHRAILYSKGSLIYELNLTFFQLALGQGTFTENKDAKFKSEHAVQAVKVINNVTPVFLISQSKPVATYNCTSTYNH